MSSPDSIHQIKVRRGKRYSEWADLKVEALFAVLDEAEGLSRT